MNNQTVSSRAVQRDVVSYRQSQSLSRSDLVTTEDPLEIRLHGQAIAVIMRTPLDDFDLAAGFLLTEGIISGPNQLGTISYCKEADPPNLENIIEVSLTDDVDFDFDRLKRNFYASSSCGVCGKASIDHIETQAPPLSDGDFSLSAETIYGLSDTLRAQQQVFDKTGSLHAAGLFDINGQLLELREDVGRHNAVDKLFGSFVLRGQLPPTKTLLMVSGRTSFEIVQKARMAGISMVAAVSAPSSLAVDLAIEAGMTLVGFLRDRSFNTYSGIHRIQQ